MCPVRILSLYYCFKTLHPICLATKKILSSLIASSYNESQEILFLGIFRINFVKKIGLQKFLVVNSNGRLKYYCVYENHLIFVSSSSSITTNLSTKPSRKSEQCSTSLSIIKLFIFIILLIFNENILGLGAEDKRNFSRLFSFQSYQRKIIFMQ